MRVGYIAVFYTEAEAQVQSSERMTSLHSRLQQEAEKIRKWKNAIELDTKHKVRCNNVADYTISSYGICVLCKNICAVKFISNPIHLFFL